MSTKLSDYVAQKVFELGIKNVFMVTGGGAMHLKSPIGDQ
jgi:acetolactate synthase-1/2/3 large subunit